jgi:hypothetical protein
MGGDPVAIRVHDRQPPRGMGRSSFRNSWRIACPVDGWGTAAKVAEQSERKQGWGFPSSLEIRRRLMGSGRKAERSQL